jgi:hypothetical protein
VAWGVELGSPCLQATAVAHVTLGYLGSVYGTVIRQSARWVRLVLLRRGFPCPRQLFLCLSFRI